MHHCHCCDVGEGLTSAGRETCAVSSLNTTVSRLPICKNGCMASHFWVREALRYLQSRHDVSIVRKTSKVFRNSRTVR